MIFRINTHEYLSSKEVNALTMSTAANTIGDPELRTAYSWRKILPTIAHHLKLSQKERLALGDCKDAKAIGDEAPITLRYAEAKQGKSRVCKLVCAAVFTSLDKRGIQTFKDIPAQQWYRIYKRIYERTHEGIRERIHEGEQSGPQATQKGKQANENAHRCVAIDCYDHTPHMSTLIHFAKTENLAGREQGTAVVLIRSRNMPRGLPAP